MTESVQLSFEGAREDPSPFVVVYNPRVLSPALLSQVMRFGLIGPSTRRPIIFGKLKGTRDTFVAMIQSYGVPVEVVPATQSAASLGPSR